MSMLAEIRCPLVLVVPNHGQTVTDAQNQLIVCSLVGSHKFKPKSQYKLKHILPASISLMLYNSLLLPQLNYCILAWGHNCKRLIKLQKKALRIISISKYNAHTAPLFKKYRILKLPHILQLQELKFYHKYIKKQLPAYLQSIPLKQNKCFHEHLTRSHLKLHITRTNHRFAERCIRNSIPLLVNTTPMEIIKKKKKKNVYLAK